MGNATKKRLIDIREVNPDVDSGQVLALVRKAILECDCGGDGARIGGSPCPNCGTLRQILKEAAE